MTRPASHPVRRHLTVALLASLGTVVGVGGGCGSSEATAPGGFTSVPQEPQDTAPTTTTPVVQEGNDANAALGANVPVAPPADGGDVTMPATNANAAASGNTRTLVISDGFGLTAPSYQGQCLTSSDATPKVGSTLKFAPCANVPAQAFAYWKGTLALSRSLCVQSNGIGNKMTLAHCDASAAQVWELNGNTHYLRHTIAGNSLTGQTGVWSTVAPDTSGSLVTQAAGTGSPVALFTITRPGTDGMRLHARTTASSASDRCFADVAGALVLQDCAVQTAEQVWGFSNNQLVSVLGQRCLTGDPSTKAVSLGACITPLSPTQQWYLMDFFLSLMTPSTTNDAGSLVLVLQDDATPSGLKLAPSAGSRVSISLAAPSYF